MNQLKICNYSCISCLYFIVKENLVMSNSSKVSVVREGFAERGFVEIFCFPFFLINEQEISTLNCLFKGYFTLFCISNLIMR